MYEELTELSLLEWSPDELIIINRLINNFKNYRYLITNTIKDDLKYLIATSIIMKKKLESYEKQV